MIVNFRTRRISRGTHKLTRIPTLNLKKLKKNMKCSMKLHRNRYAYAVCFDGRTQANYKHLNDIAYGFSLSYWELSMCSLPFFSFNDQSLKAAADRRITMDHPTENHRKHCHFEEGIPNETALCAVI